jgi:hypothetical protein
MTISHSSRLSDLWREYITTADASVWMSYQGSCQCPECRAFRKGFEGWLLSRKHNEGPAEPQTMGENA